MLKVRDRKVVRAASRCMGSTTGMDRHAPVVQAPSYSPPRCRPITSDGAFGAKTGSILLTVVMLRKDVFTSNRYYVCTTGMCSPRVSSLSTQFRRSRIQEASRWVPLS